MRDCFQVTSLPPPWGTCVLGARPYATCMADCRNLKVSKLCGCKDMHMSELQFEDGGYH